MEVERFRVNDNYWSMKISLVKDIVSGGNSAGLGKLSPKMVRAPQVERKGRRWELSPILLDRLHFLPENQQCWEGSNHSATVSDGNNCGQRTVQ